MPASISLRTARVDDEAFQLAVYASTRAAELSLVDWGADQKQAFVAMQFDAQKQHYSRFYPEAEYSIILRGQDPIGRLIVDRSGRVILLMDITLLPEYCNQGIGGGLIRELMAEAGRTGRPLRLHVETFNPALHLYQRLGFKKIAEKGIYLEMEWQPGPLPEPGEAGKAMGAARLPARGDFSGCLHTRFRVKDELPDEFDLELVQVSDLRSSPQQVNFSIIFQGPQERFMPQRIYRLEHNRLGELELFLVPIGQKGETIQYEAVFNTLVEAQ